MEAVVERTVARLVQEGVLTQHMEKAVATALAERMGEAVAASMAAPPSPNMSGAAAGRHCAPPASSDRLNMPPEPPPRPSLLKASLLQAEEACASPTSIRDPLRTGSAQNRSRLKVPALPPRFPALPKVQPTSPPKRQQPVGSPVPSVEATPTQAAALSVAIAAEEPSPAPRPDIPPLNLKTIFLQDRGTAPSCPSSGVAPPRPSPLPKSTMDALAAHDLGTLSPRTRVALSKALSKAKLPKTPPPFPASPKEPTSPPRGWRSPVPVSVVAAAPTPTRRVLSPPPPPAPPPPFMPFPPAVKPLPPSTLPTSPPAPLLRQIVADALAAATPVSTAALDALDALDQQQIAARTSLGDLLARRLAPREEEDDDEAESLAIEQELTRRAVADAQQAAKGALERTITAQRLWGSLAMLPITPEGASPPRGVQATWLQALEDEFLEQDKWPPRPPLRRKPPPAGLPPPLPKIFDC